MTNILNIFSHNKVTSFVESACWPDDQFSYGLFTMFGWHFIDLPVTYPPNSKEPYIYKPDDALGIIVYIF